MVATRYYCDTCLRDTVLDVAADQLDSGRVCGAVGHATLVAEGKHVNGNKPFCTGVLVRPISAKDIPAMTAELAKAWAGELLEKVGESKLGLFNFAIAQWWWVRFVEDVQIGPMGMLTQGYGIIGPVVPMTGWFGRYVPRSPGRLFGAKPSPPAKTQRCRQVVEDEDDYLD